MHPSTRCQGKNVIKRIVAKNLTNARPPFVRCERQWDGGRAAAVFLSRQRLIWDRDSGTAVVVRLQCKGTAAQGDSSGGGSAVQGSGMPRTFSPGLALCSLSLAYLCALTSACSHELKYDEFILGRLNILCPLCPLLRHVDLSLCYIQLPSTMERIGFWNSNLCYDWALKLPNLQASRPQKYHEIETGESHRIVPFITATTAHC